MNDGLGEGTPPTPGKKEARGRKRRSDEPVSKVRVVISISIIIIVICINVIRSVSTSGGRRSCRGRWRRAPGRRRPSGQATSLYRAP